MKINLWLILVIIGVMFWVMLSLAFMYLIHDCPPPTRLNIQRHWQEAHDPEWKIQNTLDSKMLDICSRECWPEYWKTMEEGE